MLLDLCCAVIQMKMSLRRGKVYVVKLEDTTTLILYLMTFGRLLFSLSLRQNNACSNWSLIQSLPVSQQFQMQGNITS